MQSNIRFVQNGSKDVWNTKKKVVKNIQYGEYVYTMLQLIIKRTFLATSLSNLATYFSNICSKTY